MKRYDYIVISQDEVFPDDKKEFVPKFEHSEKRWIAEDAAEDYFHYQEGYRDEWPAMIEVFEDYKSIGVFEIDYENNPLFHATKKEETD